MLSAIAREARKYETQDRARDAVAIDQLIKEEAKGQIVTKEEGDFVTINIGSNRKLKPQVRFLVISSGVSWLALRRKGDLPQEVHAQQRSPTL